jgi:hypothetical protein
MQAPLITKPMKRTYFEEVQRTRENPWILVLILVTILAALIPLGTGVYWQLIKGEPWGNEPLSDRGLILLFIFIVVVCSLSAWILLSLTLEVKVDDQGIHYRFVPVKFKWQLISIAEIAQHSFENQFGFFEAPRLGYHRNRFKNTISFRVAGRQHERITLKNGRKFLFGTQHGEEFDRALKRILYHDKETF